MELRTSVFVNLRVFPTGRALFALRLTREAAAKVGDEVLVAKTDRAIALAERARHLERQWEVQRTRGNSGAGREVVDADNALDGEVASFDRVLAAEANRWKRRDPDKTARIIATRQVLFPQGVAKVINAVYEEELAAVDDLRALCDPESDHHDDTAVQVVGELGLGVDLAEIGRLATALRTLMQRDTPDRLDFKAVRAARTDLQDALSAVFVQALATTEPSDADPEAVGRRAALLRAILEQDEDIRSYNTRSQLVPDVDPTTGSPTPDATPDAAPTDA